MADKSIYLPVSPNAQVWKWGARHYFFNCHREGGDFDWFVDNISEAEGSPSAAEVNAKWTFGGKWDPETTTPAVLPFVSLPNPRDGSYRISSEGPVLRWIPSRNAQLHEVRFGKTNKPEFRQSAKVAAFSPGRLERNTTYFWQINEIGESDTLPGPVWHFTTN